MFIFWFTELLNYNKKLHGYQEDNLVRIYMKNQFWNGAALRCGFIACLGMIIRIQKKIQVILKKRNLRTIITDPWQKMDGSIEVVVQS